MIGDFNNDSKLDLAILSSDCPDRSKRGRMGTVISLLLGNGDGTFRAPLMALVESDGSYRPPGLGRSKRFQQ